MTILFIIWMVVSVAGLGYCLRYPIRRWYRANMVNRDLSPHQRWPEILHWQEGDEFTNGPFGGYTFHLVAVQSDGYAVLSHFKHKQWFKVGDIVGYNISAWDRQIDENLKNSDNYMELIKQFNIAYAELQKRDEKLKLVS